MGGQLIKGYALQGDSQGLVGLTKAWKLYRGHKAQTHTLASIFLIQKKQLKKSDREETIKMTKKQASSLLRVRHPGVLAVVEPLTEDENIVAFVTERVEGSISQLIKSGKMAQFLNSELQLKLYLYPFLQTISFIHDSLRQAHLAISPDNIYITPDGKWKLAGFGVNQQLTGEQKQVTDQKIHDYSYSAPQLASSNSFSRKSDLFSIGIFIIRILQFINKEPQRQIPVIDKSQYEKYSVELKRLLNSPVIGKSSHSSDLQELLKGLVDWQSERRINISQVLSSRWMNDSTLITVKYLDKISNYENKQQLQFLKGLSGVLDDFDTRVLSRIVLPKLLDLLKFGHLIASVAYIIIDFLKKGRITSELFNKQVWPALKIVMQGKEMTAQAIYLFVLNYEILQKFVGEADSITYLLPLYIKCFDCPPKLKQLALRSIQRVSKKLDYPNFKTRVVPKLLGLFKDPSLDIRKDALRALYGILKSIDAQTLSLSVLPSIQIARKAGSDPFVNSIINAIYNNLSSSLPSQVLSSKILPVLIPYLSQASISKNEFIQFKATILNMIGIIEKDRQKSFTNSISVEETHFTQADFKFKQQEKPQTEVKGNYNFLTNYIQNVNNTTNATNATNTTNTSNTTSVANNNATIIGNTGNGSNNAPTSVSTPNVYQAPTNAYQVPQINPVLPTNQQPLNFQPLSNSKPIAPKIEVQAIQTKSSNKPMEPIQIKPTTNMNFPIKLQFPQPVSQSTDFDFQSLNKYQPLDLNFTNQSPSIDAPILSFDLPSKQEKKVEQPILKPPKTSPIIPTKQLPTPKKESKFVGGTSGPMEIKKIIGPGQKIKPPTQEQPKIQPSIDLNYFQAKPAPKVQSPAFSMQFGGLGDLGGFGAKLNADITSSFAKPKTVDPLKTQPIMITGLKVNAPDLNNPFAELQQNLSTQNNAMFSYFQEDDKPKPTNSMDLI